MRVVICGGGVIGASIAYFLACRGIKPVVVEAVDVACAASGKSGGFLALDWCDGTPLAQLARCSFALHAALPEAIGNDWDYRSVITYGGFANAQGSVRQEERACNLPWLAEHVRLGRQLGSQDTTAQVHPGKFTAAMMREAQTHGAELRFGRVTNILQASGRVRGVAIGDEILECEAVVIAMGPWSVLAARWLPLPPVFGLKGHSLVFETGTEISAEALFLEYREPDGRLQSPEVFPRADGTTYVCAISSESPVPLDPRGVEPDPGAIERLQTLCHRISPTLATAKVLARQACFRPVTPDGLPLIGRVAGLDNAYLATGHSVWGILNAPATGEAIAELIVDGVAQTIDLSPFDPGRIAALDPARLKSHG